MLTPKEYIEKKPAQSHLYALEVFEHILQGDYKKTAYRDSRPNMGVFQEFQDEMEKHTQGDSLSEIYEDTFRQDYELKPVRSDGGELVLERYVEGDESPFDEWIKVESHKPAVTIIMDMGIPWGEREDQAMKERHDKIYKIVADCESEGRPCRVIAVESAIIPEIEGRPLTIFLTVKDYSDPIFTGIWGALKNNLAANCLGNAIYDFLVGTSHYGNGTPVITYLGGEFEDDEVIVIDGKRVSREIAPWNK